MVLPAGIPKCGSCSAVLRRPQETIELSSLLFLSAALIQDLSVPSDSTISFYIGVCPPACLASHIIVLALSAEKWVGERAAWKSWEEPGARWHNGEVLQFSLEFFLSLGPWGGRRWQWGITADNLLRQIAADVWKLFHLGPVGSSLGFNPSFSPALKSCVLQIGSLLHDI